MAKNESKAAAKAPAPHDFRNVLMKDGALTLAGQQEAHDRLRAALGGLDDSSQALMVGHLMDLLPKPESDDYTFQLRASVEMMEGIAPANGAEAMLGAQMVAAHLMSMNFSRRALKSDRVDFANTYANIATKAQRTFAAQIEGMAKLRRNGEQTVKHVHVNAGGQAVIADTFNAGGGQDD